MRIGLPRSCKRGMASECRPRSPLLGRMGATASPSRRGVRLCVLGGVCVSGLLLRMCPTAGIVLREMAWRCGGLYFVLAAVCEAGWYRFSCEGTGGLLF